MAASLTAAAAQFQQQQSPLNITTESIAAASSVAVVPELLEVADIPGKGRGLISTQPLAPGQIILRDSPLLLYPAFPLTSSSNTRNYCSHCFRSFQNTTQMSSQQHSSCSSCAAAIFCNPSCRQASLASSHTPWLCRALSLLRSCPSVQALDEERQLALPFLIAAYNLAQVEPRDFGRLLDLHGVAACGEESAGKLLHSIIASAVPPPPPPAAASFTAEVTATLLAKDKVNAFGLLEALCREGKNEVRSVRAYGIYPRASYFNHDCLPNACRFEYVDACVGNNTDIVVRMIHEVPQGREICLSYFPINQRFRARQNRLREDYGFFCGCERCRIESNWSDDDDDDDDDDMAEEEDHGGQEEAEEEQQQVMEVEECGGGDFPHAYFFLKFMCNEENCWGTLAPLPPSPHDGTPSDIMECSVCGNLLLNKNDDDHDDEE